MQLTLWTYEGPPHVGAMRIATAMKGLHYVLHAPQGDTYADLLFTMIERRDRRPPVTYTTFQARDLGKDTAELLQDAIREAAARFEPQALLVFNPSEPHSGRMGGSARWRYRAFFVVLAAWLLWTSVRTFKRFNVLTYMPPTPTRSPIAPPSLLKYFSL